MAGGLAEQAEHLAARGENLPHFVMDLMEYFVHLLEYAEQSVE